MKTVQNSLVTLDSDIERLATLLIYQVLTMLTMLSARPPQQRCPAVTAHLLQAALLVLRAEMVPFVLCHIKVYQRQLQGTPFPL